MGNEQSTAQWAQCTVADVAELLRGVSYAKEQSSKNPKPGLKPILRANNINQRLSFDDLVFVPESLINAEQMIKKGDIIFAMSSGSINLVGKSARADFDFDGSYGAFCARLRPAPQVSNKYLYYLFQDTKFRSAVGKFAKGSNINNLKREHIIGYKLSIAPVSEQHRIVAKIEELFSELDKGVETLRTAQQQLQVYRQTLLKHAFEGNLTADWRAQNPDKLESADSMLARIQQDREARYRQQMQEWEANGRTGSRPKTPKELPPLAAEELAKLPELPAGWGWFTLAQLLSEDLCNGKSVKDRADGFPVLRLNALNNGSIDLSFTKQGDWSEEEARPYFVKENDFLVSRGNGSKHLVGRGGFAHYSTATANHVAFPDTMIRVRVCQENIDRLYFGYCWGSSLVRSQIEKSARTTAGIYKINQGLMERFLIPIPCIEEQTLISSLLSEKLSLIDQLEQTIAHSQQQAEALRQSILKKAFSGQLAQQDPNDEPASVLLERIRAERAAQPKARGRKARASA